MFAFLRFRSAPPVVDAPLLDTLADARAAAGRCGHRLRPTLRRPALPSWPTSATADQRVLSFPAAGLELAPRGVQAPRPALG